jgi:hypothetical protein
MKLDKDLVREILLQVEAYPHPMGWVEVSVPGHSAEEIAHHVELLGEAGVTRHPQGRSRSSSRPWSCCVKLPR